jgi:ferredoxin
MAGERFSITLEGHGAGSGYADERVLVALERAQGFGQLKNMPRRLPVGCRRGGCGVCRVRVTQGDFHADAMSRAHISAEEEAAAIVLACCIYPRSDLSLRLEPIAAVKGNSRASAENLLEEKTWQSPA